jgi:CDP-paratose 2-epimerase
MQILITGGAGFIGSNAAAELMRAGHRVFLFDNLSRPGSEDNLAWVQSLGAVDFIRGDVRDSAQVQHVFSLQRFDAVLHLAAQVAVTSAVANPLLDFTINAQGTLNVLEAIREDARRPILILASTNKVYGALQDLEIVATDHRYSSSISDSGIDESRPLDFHSPYGCSKGAADQYVHDYARIYGCRTVVLRQSCIYGPRQFGIEDQGWLSWFVIAALLGWEVTVFGNGKQVRDVLEVSDLVRLYRLCLERIDAVQGEILNVGGGPENSLSILETLALLEKELGLHIAHHFAPERPGDQKIYISSNEKADRLLGWRPEVNITEGLRRLVSWIKPNLDLILTRVGSA